MTVSIPEESSEVVFATIQKEIIRLRKKIESLLQNLQKYEKQYNMSSEEFINKFDQGKLGDEEVFFEWYADVKTLREVQKNCNSWRRSNLIRDYVLRLQRILQKIGFLTNYSLTYQIDDDAKTAKIWISVDFQGGGKLQVF